MTEHLILGAAGHIDHGKTALVRSLSGVDTDRLPEEKRRGITIDLGFASVDLGPYRLGLVNVPGHERFIRNMLAGATGMDLVMLVVAADDSVKQQTREHLDILRLLDLRHGLIALTKCDLVDESWQELVEQEIREAVEGSFLADAPLLRTSVVTGQGLESLRAALLDQAAHAAVDPRRRQRQASPFRMPADRAFVREGHGAVVTGSVASGSVKLGATLELLPQRTEVRVRGLQSHDVAVEHIQCGQRAAINLAGVRWKMFVAATSWQRQATCCPRVGLPCDWKFCPRRHGRSKIARSCVSTPAPTACAPKSGCWTPTTAGCSRDKPAGRRCT